MKRILMLVLVGLSLAGCEVQPKHPSIFENRVCEPPCWENITPGVTTKADALAIISHIEQIDQPVSTSDQPVGVFNSVLVCTFYKDIDRLGFLYIYNNLVYKIRFTNHLNITLEEAIQLFGIPKGVQVSHSGEFSDIGFINPDLGIVFSYRFFSNKSSINPTTKISEVDFFDPTQIKWYQNTNSLPYSTNADGSIKNMVPWKGYGDVKRLYLP